MSPSKVLEKIAAIENPKVGKDKNGKPKTKKIKVDDKTRPKYINEFVNGDEIMKKTEVQGEPVFKKRIILNKFLEIVFNGDKQIHSYCSLSRILEVIQEGCLSSILPYGVYNLADKEPVSIDKIKSQQNISSIIVIPVSANLFLKSRDLFRSTVLTDR